MGKVCETWGCGQIAASYVTCEGEGKYPYCAECTETLTGAGHQQNLGPVQQVTDEMIERGASALAIANGYNPNSEDPSRWPRTTARYREAAETVLTAALHWQLSSETNEGENDE